MAGLVPFNSRGFNNMLDDFFNFNWPAQRSLMNDTFKLDVEETEQAYEISAELPGIAKEEIGLDLTEGKLTISVTRAENVNEEKRNYVHRERRAASMARSLYLSDADTDDITAKLDNGVLLVTVRKQEKTQKSRKIEIM